MWVIKLMCWMYSSVVSIFFDVRPSLTNFQNMIMLFSKANSQNDPNSLIIQAEYLLYFQHKTKISKAKVFYLLLLV